MHPRLRDGVSLGTFSYAGQSGQHYYAENDRQEMFELCYPLYCELARADGTCPLSITKRVLRSLQARRILTTRRWQFQGLRGQLTLVVFGRQAQPPRRLCRVLNRALVLAFLPVLAAGLLAKRAPRPDAAEVEPLLFFPLVVLSALLHEMGHFAAAAAAGWEVSELGLFLVGPFPTGAYIACTDQTRGLRRQKVQICLAGIEMNLLLAGFLRLLAGPGGIHSPTLDAVCLANGVQALVNLLPAQSLDGCRALETLLGMEDLYAAARQFRTSKPYRRQILRKGPGGYGWIVLFFLCRLSGAAIKILMVLDGFCFVLLIFFWLFPAF